MRIILVGLYLFIFGIFSIIALPLLWMTGKFNSGLQRRISQRIVKLAFGVSKKEIAKVPGLRIWMKFINCVFLDRENPREGIKAILKGIENIKSGISMFISPEGTRNSGEGLLEFKPGSLKMAEKTGCPIVPVAITNADKVFEDHLPWIQLAL